MPQREPRYLIGDDVRNFAGQTGRVIDILEFDPRSNGFKYRVSRGPTDRSGSIWVEASMQTVDPRVQRPRTDTRSNISSEPSPIFRPGDQVTDLDESMEGTVMFVATNGPFDACPFRCLVQETSDGRYRERTWDENKLKLLKSGPGSFDMRPNAKGTYSGTAAQEDDYVIWQHGTSRDYFVDRVGRGGKAVRGIGSARGSGSLKAAVQVVRAEALRRGYTSGIIFEQRAGEDDLRQIGQVKRGTGMDFEQNGTGSRRPKFELGQRVTRTDDSSYTGEVSFIGPWQGEEYGGYSIKVQWDDGRGRLFVPENKLRLLRGHSPNASRAEPDETAARELSLYIENEYSLVGAPNSQGKAIEKNLLLKLKKGTFDLALSEKAWMYLMEAGAKKYCKEFADPKDWATIFNKATRELVAHEFATTFYEEHKATGGLSRNASDFTVEEFDAPAHWASAFINGDTSGLEEDDLAELEAWQAKHPDLGWVVDASEETHMGRFNGLQTELCTYTAHVR